MRKSLVPLLIVGLLAAWSLLFVASAAAAGPPVRPTQTTSCATVVERVSPTSSATRLVSQTCRKLTTLRRTAGAGAAAAVTPAIGCGTCTPLLIVYQNLNYGGSSNVYYGNSGRCDATGYSINSTVGGDWGDKISSMRWANNCVNIDGFHDLNQTGFCIHWHGNVSYVGATLNDHV